MQLKKTIEKLMAMPGAVKPEKARFFRSQMQTIITKALTDVGIKAVPSRRCFTVMGEEPAGGRGACGRALPLLLFVVHLWGEVGGTCVQSCSSGFKHRPGEQRAVHTTVRCIKQHAHAGATWPLQFAHVPCHPCIHAMRASLLWPMIKCRPTCQHWAGHFVLPPDGLRAGWCILHTMAPYHETKPHASVGPTCALPLPGALLFLNAQTTTTAWISERLEQVYKPDPRYSDKAQSLFQLDLGPPEVGGWLAGCWGGRGGGGPAARLLGFACLRCMRLRVCADTFCVRLY